MYDATLAETVTIRGDGGDEIEAYLARPMSQGPLGGVVVIHHMPGYDPPIKETQPNAMNVRFHGNGGTRGAPSAQWALESAQMLMPASTASRSIAASSSSVKLVWSAAARFSSSCATLLAPMRTEVTRWSRSAQDSAS